MYVYNINVYEYKCVTITEVAIVQYSKEIGCIFVNYFRNAEKSR